MKVLVIEDDFEHMRIVRCGLDEAGFVCDAAKTGAQGRDMLANGAYDVAILDRMLPKYFSIDGRPLPLRKWKTDSRAMRQPLHRILPAVLTYLLSI